MFLPAAAYDTLKPPNAHISSQISAREYHCKLITASQLYWYQCAQLHVHAEHAKPHVSACRVATVLVIHGRSNSFAEYENEGRMCWQDADHAAKKGDIGICHHSPMRLAIDARTTLTLLGIRQYESSILEGSSLVESQRILYEATITMIRSAAVQ